MEGKRESLCFASALMQDKQPKRPRKADLILLGPQIRYLQKRISEMAPGKPVEVIDMMAYGMMDGKKVYSDIKKYMED